jgi:hypothetical protein
MSGRRSSKNGMREYWLQTLEENSLRLAERNVLSPTQLAHAAMLRVFIQDFSTSARLAILEPRQERLDHIEQLGRQERMSAMAIHAMAVYGPFAPANPLSPEARLTLHAMAEGHERLEDAARATGLSVTQVIDAFNELADRQVAIWALGWVWYRIGDRWADRFGRSLEDELTAVAV